MYKALTVANLFNGSLILGSFTAEAKIDSGVLLGPRLQTTRKWVSTSVPRRNDSRNIQTRKQRPRKIWEQTTPYTFKVWNICPNFKIFELCFQTFLRTYKYKFNLYKSNMSRNKGQSEREISNHPKTPDQRPAVSKLQVGCQRVSKVDDLVGPFWHPAILHHNK